MIRAIFRSAAASAALLAAWLTLPAAQADEADYAKLSAEKSPACVMVKFVLKIKGAAGEMDNESETNGVMIEPDGLVLCSNSQLGGGPLMRPGVQATPTEIKILVGDDTQGLDARLVARDSDLDLTWLRIKQPGERKFAAIDLTRSAAPKLGERLYTLVRLGKYFDRAVVLREIRLGGETKKPRHLYVPSASVGGLGLPIFSAAGEFVALSVVQLPDAEELQNATSMTAYAGGNGILLPAAEVAKATQRAKESDTGEDKAAEPDKKDAGEKPGGATQPAGTSPADKPAKKNGND